MTRAIPIQELLDELDVYRDRNMIARALALAIDPQYPFRCWLSWPDRIQDGNRLDWIAFSCWPIRFTWPWLTREKDRDNSWRSETFIWIPKTCWSEECRAPDESGGKVLAITNIWRQGRRRILRCQLWPLGNTDQITGRQTDRDHMIKFAHQMKPAGTKAIILELRNQKLFRCCQETQKNEAICFRVV